MSRRTPVRRDITGGRGFRLRLSCEAATRDAVAEVHRQKYRFIFILVFLSILKKSPENKMSNYYIYIWISIDQYIWTNHLYKFSCYDIKQQLSGIYIIFVFIVDIYWLFITWCNTEWFVCKLETETTIFVWYILISSERRLHMFSRDFGGKNGVKGHFFYTLFVEQLSCKDEAKVFFLLYSYCVFLIMFYTLVIKCFFTYYFNFWPKFRMWLGWMNHFRKFLSLSNSSDDSAERVCVF